MPVPFAGKEFTFTNPDGSEIRVLGWGNQFAAVFETLDGYTVVQDPESGFYHYATLSADKASLVPSGTRVDDRDPQLLGLARHIRIRKEAAKARALEARDASGVQPRWQIRRQERQRQKAEAPPGKDLEEEPPSPAAKVGSFVGLCVLVQFPDVPGTITQQEVTNFCNQSGYSNFGNNGSVYDYFYDVSRGKLRYTNVVAAYYTAKHNRSYYTDPQISYGIRAQELIKEALDALKAQGFNFSQLSSDSGGYVYALNVFYAGPCVNAWRQGLWPHSSSLGSYVASSTRKFADYQITDMGTQLTLGTFCHENGHMICDFPDLYDYGYESYGCGDYCLMAYGGSSGMNPTQVCAFLKNQAGWTSKLMTAAPGMVFTMAAGANEFLIHRKNATEYFILENREKTGRDSTLPDAGLAIWHVDETGSNNNEQMTPAQHYECSLEQADNRWDLEHGKNLGDSDDLLGSPAKTTFGASTAPASKWWDGTPSGLEITDVAAPAASITVTTLVQWQYGLNVVRTHAKNGSQMAWAIVGNSPWLLVQPMASDGVTNVFGILCEALANGRKVDVLIVNGLITQATLA